MYFSVSPWTSHLFPYFVEKRTRVGIRVVVEAELVAERPKPTARRGTGAFNDGVSTFHAEYHDFHMGEQPYGVAHVYVVNNKTGKKRVILSLSAVKLKHVVQERRWL